MEVGLGGGGGGVASCDNQDLFLLCPYKLALHLQIKTWNDKQYNVGDNSYITNILVMLFLTIQYSFPVQHVLLINIILYAWKMKHFF